MAQYDLGKVSIRPRGAYAANTNYEFLDSVQNLGGSWLALAASKDVQPGVTAGWQNYWMMITRGIKTIVGSSPADGQTQITITFTDGATATYTYNNEVLANGSVTRANLANDALYSPNVHLGASNATFSISSGSVGKTFIANNSTTDFVITVPAETSIPTGFEIALLRFSCKSMKITFASGIKVLVYGNNSPLTAPTFNLETYAMVALKKISSSDYWLLTGPAEVVT